jgi:hypothetical protein
MAVEMKFAVIQADIARHFPIRNRDVGIAVAVQVSNCCISSGPMWIAIGPPDGEIALSIVEED